MDRMRMYELQNEFYRQRGSKLNGSIDRWIDQVVETVDSRLGSFSESTIRIETEKKLADYMDKCRDQYVHLRAEDIDMGSAFEQATQGLPALLDGTDRSLVEKIETQLSGARERIWHRGDDQRNRFPPSFTKKKF